jgi:long-chain acyl-CoA synthetase
MRMTSVFHDFAEVADKFAARTAVEVCRRGGVETHTYAELRSLAELVSVLIQAAGVRAGERCAILADNDARWCGTYLGILRAGNVAVPLDTAYRPDQIRTILSDCEARLVFTSERYLAAVRDAVASMPSGSTVVLMSGSGEAGILSLDGQPPLRDASVLPPCPATLSDPAVTLYTSGTTSDPKGVVLTHGNLLAEKSAAFQVVKIIETDAILGVLPLFHALAQIANLLLPFTAGARVVFLETVNSAEMMRAFTERHVTAFCVVPQFFYLLHQRITERVAASPLPARAMHRVLLRFNGGLRRRLGVNLGRLLFRRVHQALGGRMRVLVSGGSRFDPGIGRDLYCMGLNILQAYGLTECSAAATVTRPGDPHVDTVGHPLPGVEVKILAQPSDGNSRDHPDGEVLIRGPNVMAGYHGRPDATAEALRDGWLYTGDLGYLDKEGRLRITGRKKEIIVLASGKNIYPEEIENHYLQSPYIKEICVLGTAVPGEPAAERLHGIVVPNTDLLRERRVVNMREMIRWDIEGLSLKLPHYKRVLSFDLWREDLPRTTTRKLKRHEIERLCRERQAEVAGPAEPARWSEADQVWGADPHVERVLGIIRGAAKAGSPITPDANLELDIGLDSMERVELLTSLEHAFGVDVPDEISHVIYTVRDLVEAVRPRMDSAAAAPAPVDPWARVLAQDPDDPVLASLAKPKHFFAPFAFCVLKSAYAFARIFFGLRVSGREHIPRNGPFLLSPNHQSYLDSFLLVSSLPWRNFRRLFFVGASEYFATPFMQKLARLINVVPVDPDTNLVRAMQAGGFGLRRQRVLVLFPEGERSPDGTVRTFKKGAAILSHQLGVPIVPVAIRGVFEIWPRGEGPQWSVLRPWGSARARLQFGPPVNGGPPSGDEGLYAGLTETLRTSVIRMWNELR